MKTKITFLVVSVLCACSMLAQVTITQHSLGPIGSQQIEWTKEFPVPSMIPGSGGSNQYWDFSSLSTNDGSTTVFFRDPQTMPEGAFFPTANYGYEDTLNDFRAYLIVGNDSVLTVGVSSDLGFSNNSTIFERPYELSVLLPMNFGDNVVRDFRREVWEPNLGYIPSNFDSIYLKSTIRQIDTIDGFGNLILPEHGTGIPLSFQCLRKKSWENRIDSSFARDTTNGWIFLNEDVYSQLEYEWYEPFQGKIATAYMAGTTHDTVASITFRDLDYMVRNENANSLNPNIQCFPNPIVDRSQIEFDALFQANFKFQVLDLAGIQQFEMELGILNPGQHRLLIGEGMKQLPDGIYFGILTAEGKTQAILKMLKN